jgi:nucleoside-diphosphate-sugar epimerase
MALHVIVGAGATAAATARLLAERDEPVRLVSRSGTGPRHPLIETIRLDARDTDALAESAKGATTLFNCAAPAYHTWPEALPPLFRSILTAAERTEAGYVMLGNLYGYGPHEGVLTEEYPLAATGPKGKVRAQMWLEAERAFRQDRVRVCEVRAAQFLGPAAYSVFTLTVQPQVLAGRLVVVPQSPDAPHAFAAIEDVARTLVTVAHDERSWGQAWHAPVIESSVRALAGRLADLAGAPTPRLHELTEREEGVLALTSPLWGELYETRYMSHRPFHVSSARVAETFGLRPTPVDEVLRKVVGDVQVAA